MKFLDKIIIRKILKQESGVKKLETILNFLKKNFPIFSPDVEKYLKLYRELELYKIEAAVAELTNKCDLDCKFCSRNKENNLDFNLFKSLTLENNQLGNPIKSFELGGMGNPLLYPKIKEVLKLLHRFNQRIIVITNGLNLKEIISYFDDLILQNVQFCLYLDSSNQEKNDYLMGRKVFNKTLESIGYLLDRKLKYSIFMRTNSQNFKEIEEMLEISKYYRCSLFVPMEVFPLGRTAEEFLLDKEAKAEVIKTIDKLREAGEQILKNIHFESPENNCSYLRKKRLFINSQGKLSFCHFLSSLKMTEIVDIKGKSLIELIKIDNEIRDAFLKKKEENLGVPEFKKTITSPCNYCLGYYGFKS